MRRLTLITNTGHLTLLVEVRTNFVVTAFIGLFCIPIGGTSCNTNIYKNCLFPFLQNPLESGQLEHGSARMRTLFCTYIIVAAGIRLDGSKVSVVSLPKTILQKKKSFKVIYAVKSPAV